MYLQNDTIHIHGILPRSGTNLLNHILRLHPDCVQPTVKIRENWFLGCSDSLYDYAEHLFRIWASPAWKGNEFSKQLFFYKIGEALLDYLADEIPDFENKILITKTPSVRNLQRCFELFPSAKVIIIIRDPRDVAASTFRTWKRPTTETIAQWNLACQQISAFEKNTDPNRYCLIRYEDLVIKVESVTRQMLKFLELDETKFPWQELSQLPILGSSDYSKWEKVEASTSFQPFGKWSLLPKEQKLALNSLDTLCLTYSGYPVSVDDELPPLPRREERLQIDIKLNYSSQTTQKPRSSWRTRISKLRKGLGIISEAILGEKISMFLRKGLKFD